MLYLAITKVFSKIIPLTVAPGKMRLNGLPVGQAKSSMKIYKLVINLVVCLTKWTWHIINFTDLRTGCIGVTAITYCMLSKFCLFVLSLSP